MFLTDTLAKTLQNNFVYSFVSGHSKNLLFFEQKKCIFSGAARRGGVNHGQWSKLAEKYALDIR